MTEQPGSPRPHLSRRLPISKAGGGVGTNQYQIRGQAKTAMTSPALTIFDPATPGGSTSLLDRAKDPQTSSAVLAELARSSDSDVRLAIAFHPNTSPETLSHLVLTNDGRMRQAVAQHPSTPVHTLDALVKEYTDQLAANRADKTPHFAAYGLTTGNTIDTVVTVAGHPNCTPETLEKLAESPIPAILWAIIGNSGTSAGLMHEIAAYNQKGPEVLAAHPKCPHDLLAIYAQGPDWTLQTKVAENPATPESVLITMLQSKDPHIVRQAAIHPNCPPYIRAMAALADIPGRNSQTD